MRFKLLISAAIVSAVVVTGVTVLTPSAQAAAINVSDAQQHRIRKAVNRYAEIQVAQREPYCYGGTGPGCFDCSGLVVAAYRYAGVNLPGRGVRTSRQLYSFTTRISLPPHAPGTCCSTTSTTTGSSPTWRSCTARTGPERGWPSRPPTRAAPR